MANGLNFGYFPSFLLHLNEKPFQFFRLTAKCFAFLRPMVYLTETL